MTQTPTQKRHSRCKAKVMNSLLHCYKAVKTAPWPCHFFCQESKTFIRVEVNDLDENMKARLQKFKMEMCKSGEKVQVFLYKKYAHKPEIEEIE